MDKNIIKEVVKEMIRDREIEVGVEIHTSKIDTDDFGNSYGALESIELEVWLEVCDD